MFVASPDRELEAYDAKTGNVLWQFRTSAAAGPVTIYEVDGTEYVATVAGANVWAFALGGTLPPAAGPPRPVPTTEEDFVGVIAETTQIETAALQRDRAFTGTRYFTDEHAFEPYRTRVKVGTQVTWRNNGPLVHTIIAQDGSWTTGPLHDAEVGAKLFDKAGRYTYICKEHPWAYGQIIVE